MSQLPNPSHEILVIWDYDDYNHPNVEDSLVVFRALSDSDTRADMGMPEYDPHSELIVDGLATKLRDYSLARISDTINVPNLHYDSRVKALVEVTPDTSLAYDDPRHEPDFVDVARPELQGPLSFVSTEAVLIRDMLYNRRAVLARLAKNQAEAVPLTPEAAAIAKLMLASMSTGNASQQSSLEDSSLGNDTAEYDTLGRLLDGPQSTKLAA